ncbi:G-protein-signaling modulator 2 [Cynoglossus semilaevis]|uniref:G-protein-signaling modulator 2 n=1 Tax=Cynoglossus semilaevis TaxID=244447 RepID=UPI0004975A20|nr:G-protein-signaling modulator 2-like [Cynoglossus semilaevis]
MDSRENKVEMAGEEGQLEPLVITEEGETNFVQKETTFAQNHSKESFMKEEEKHKGEEKSEMCSEEKNLETQPVKTESDQGKVVEDEMEKKGDDLPDETEISADRQNVENQVEEAVENKENPEKSTEAVEETVAQTEPQLVMKRLNISDHREETHRLTPDFPEALYELLCTLQEGRRLNDQRCSFTLESRGPRRRCHSEPNTNKPAHRVVFSSMTSLQREEFFELVATTQARRLDDQRAQLGRLSPPKGRFRSFRGSIKQLSLVKKPAPVTVPKEDLYDMILTTQAQGRLEDQRSRAPGPMDDEDFFSLLLRVQGGRMDEQRTALPCMLQT